VSPLLLFLLLALCISSAAVEPRQSPATLCVVVGAPGEAELGSNFVHQAELWLDMGRQAGSRAITIGLETDQTNDLERLKEAVSAEPKTGPEEFWLVLIGHGTFDGKEARFNLRGPDLSATDLAQWLQPFQRPLAIIDTASASAPFLNRLSGTNRVVISATRSGHEVNFTRFGQYLAEAISDPQADLDKDGAVSLLEAFLWASRRTGEFYKSEGRLASEHALIDDNGDGLGTQADWFRGLRAVKKAKEDAAVDGLLAQQFRLVPSEADSKLSSQQRARRDTLERAVFAYRERKGQVPEAEYYRELEKMLLELAHFYVSATTNAPAQNVQ